MRKLLTVLLISLTLGACSNGMSGTGETEFNSEMEKAYEILDSAFADDVRDLTKEEKDQLSYILYTEELDVEPGTDDYSFYLAMQKYQTRYSGYKNDVTEYADLMEAKEAADKYFD